MNRGARKVAATLAVKNDEATAGRDLGLEQDLGGVGLAAVAAADNGDVGLGAREANRGARRVGAEEDAVRGDRAGGARSRA